MPNLSHVLLRSGVTLFILEKWKPSLILNPSLVGLGTSRPWHVNTLPATHTAITHPRWLGINVKQPFMLQLPFSWIKIMPKGTAEEFGLEWQTSSWSVCGGV